MEHEKQLRIVDEISNILIRETVTELEGLNILSTMVGSILLHSPHDLEKINQYFNGVYEVIEEIRESRG